MPDAQHPGKDEITVALNQALADGDTHQLMGNLGRMARAHRMRRLAQETGLGEKSLYKSMRAGARPEIGTVIRVLCALGYRLQVTPVAAFGREQPSFMPPVSGNEEDRS